MSYEEEVSLMIGELMDTVDAEWQAEIERLAMLEAEAIEYGDEDAGYDTAWDKE